MGFWFGLFCNFAILLVLSAGAISAWANMKCHFTWARVLVLLVLFYKQHFFMHFLCAQSDNNCYNPVALNCFWALQAFRFVVFSRCVALCAFSLEMFRLG